jgi:Reverse transcriptase (RNA-dependent DNA polymerase)
VLRTKLDAHGEVVKRKARINLNETQQQPGEHFDPDDLYSPVADKDTLRAVLAASAATDMHVEHWDFESAFLHGKVPEGIELYMRQPSRAGGALTHPGCVVRISGNYYGARQGPKLFSDDLSQHLVLTGYYHSAADCCAFVIKAKDGKTTLILVVTVDDFVAVCTNQIFMDKCCEHLARKYTLKNLGPVGHVLGWKVDRDRTAHTHHLSTFIRPGHPR